MTITTVSPQVVAGAAQSVAGIGATLQQAHTLAGPATTAVVAAAGDEVSAAEAAVTTLDVASSEDWVMATA